MCGPNIPYHLIRGIGIQKAKDEKTKYPSIVEIRKKWLDEYRQHKSVLDKFQSTFADHVYLITKAPKFIINSSGQKVIKTEYFGNSKDKVRMTERLKLTKSEAYSFSVLRQSLIFEPANIQRNDGNKTKKEIEEEAKKRLGQEDNPLDISDYNIEPKYIKLVAQLLSDKYHQVPSLTIANIKECDKIVEVLMLDRERAKYFARSRACD